MQIPEHGEAGAKLGPVVLGPRLRSSTIIGEIDKIYSPSTGVDILLHAMNSSNEPNCSIAALASLCNFSKYEKSIRSRLSSRIIASGSIHKCPLVPATA